MCLQLETNAPADWEYGLSTDSGGRSLPGCPEIDRLESNNRHSKLITPKPDRLLAREESRILLVHDLDFSDLVAASGGEVPSVVIFRLRNMRPARVNEHLKRVLERHPEELESGAIFSVTEGRIRWRSLPFDRD